MKYTTHLCHLRYLTLAPTSGEVTIAGAVDVFVNIDHNFQNWGTNRTDADTKVVEVDVFEIWKDGTHKTLFDSLRRDPLSFCLSQGQIVEFCRTHREDLQKYGTFFPFAVKRENEERCDLFVARVYVHFDLLFVCVNRYEYESVWIVPFHQHLVVKQQPV